ncbi:IS5 family transposase [Microvirga alba]|uniref:IS5 family transposase n=1 Tax=Microvirga alba TaxID=2791025 RepID=UPI002D21D3A5|nr:IS5 family transposase [Microvirga alba]
MPFKHTTSRRHRIGKMKFKVTNWREYEAGLRQRGSLTLWITPEALSSWQAPRRTTRGGQPRYSDLAIETALTLGLVSDLRLRQTEGLLASVLPLMGLDLAVPDHTTLSRRARIAPSSERRPIPRVPSSGPVHVLIDSTGLEVYGAGQWLEEKHGVRSRRKLEKAASGTGCRQRRDHRPRHDRPGHRRRETVEPLLDKTEVPISQFTADGAYDGKPTYDAVTKHSANAAVVIPPRANAVERSNADVSSQRR